MGGIGNIISDLNNFILLDSVLISPSANEKCCGHILDYIGDISKVRQYNWCHYVLNVLITTHDKLDLNKSTPFTGPITFLLLQITHMEPTVEELETSYMRSLDKGELSYISVRKNKDLDEKMAPVKVKVKMEKLKRKQETIRMKRQRDEGPSGVKGNDKELITNMHQYISRANCMLSELNNNFLEMKYPVAKRSVKTAIPFFEALIKQMKHYTDVDNDEDKGNSDKGNYSIRTYQRSGVKELENAWVNKKDLVTLNPNNDLNTGIIVASSTLFNYEWKREPTKYIADPALVQLLSLGSEDIDRMLRPGAKRADLIIFPFCTQHHWLGIAFNMITKSVMLMDSFPNHVPSEECDEIFRKLKNALVKFHVKSAEITDIQHLDRRDYPTQEDTHDCGIYLLQFMEKFGSSDKIVVEEELIDAQYDVKKAPADGSNDERYGDEGYEGSYDEQYRDVKISPHRNETSPVDIENEMKKQLDKLKRLEKLKKQLGDNILDEKRNSNPPKEFSPTLGKTKERRTKLRASTILC